MWSIFFLSYYIINEYIFFLKYVNRFILFKNNKIVLNYLIIVGAFNAFLQHNNVNIVFSEFIKYVLCSSYYSLIIVQYLRFFSTYLVSIRYSIHNCINDIT